MNTSTVSRRGCSWWDGTFYGGNQEEKKLSVNKSLLNDRDRQTRWERREEREAVSGPVWGRTDGGSCPGVLGRRGREGRRRENKLIIWWFGGKESPRSVVRGKFTTKLYFSFPANTYYCISCRVEHTRLGTSLQALIAESWCPASEQRKFACKNLVWVWMVCCCKYL